MGEGEGEDAEGGEDNEESELKVALFGIFDQNLFSRTRMQGNQATSGQ